MNEVRVDLTFGTNFIEGRQSLLPNHSFLTLIAVARTIAAFACISTGTFSKDLGTTDRQYDLKQQVALADSAAHANLLSESGRNYFDSANVIAKSTLEKAFIICQDSLVSLYPQNETKRHQKEPHYFLVLLNRRGSVKSILAHPTQIKSDCVINYLSRNLLLPQPPTGNYWIKINLDKKSNNP